MWLSVSTLPPQGFMQRRSSPSKTKDPYPQLHVEVVGVDGVKSSLAHVSEIHYLINLMSLSPPPPPSLKENRYWPPPNLRPISSKSAALQCPMVQVYQLSLGTFCNIMTHVDNCAPLTSTSEKQAEPVRKRFSPPKVINCETLRSAAEGFHQQSLLIPEDTPSTVTT